MGRVVNGTGSSWAVPTLRPISSACVYECVCACDRGWRGGGGSCPVSTLGDAGLRRDGTTPPTPTDFDQGLLQMDLYVGSWHCVKTLIIQQASLLFFVSFVMKTQSLFFKCIFLGVFCKLAIFFSSERDVGIALPLPSVGLLGIQQHKGEEELFDPKAGKFA